MAYMTIMLVGQFEGLKGLNNFCAPGGTPYNILTPLIQNQSRPLCLDFVLCIS